MLVDLIEGNIRNRMIFPLVALGLYITMVFQLTDTGVSVSDVFSFKGSIVVVVEHPRGDFSHLAIC